MNRVIWNPRSRRGREFAQVEFPPGTRTSCVDHVVERVGVRASAMIAIQIRGYPIRRAKPSGSRPRRSRRSRPDPARSALGDSRRSGGGAPSRRRSPGPSRPEPAGAGSSPACGRGGGRATVGRTNSNPEGGDPGGPSRPTASGDVARSGTSGVATRSRPATRPGRRRPGWGSDAIGGDGTASEGRTTSTHRRR